MNKRKKNIKIILFICLHFIYFQSVFANYSVNIDNVRKTINSVKINDIDFVDYEQLFKVFVPKIKSNQNNYLLTDIHFSVLANPQNFFILIKSDTVENILQLSTPPIIRDNKLFIPVQSLISSLHYFLHFRYDFLRNGVFIEPNDKFFDFFEPNIFSEVFSEEKVFNEEIFSEDDIFNEEYIFSDVFNEVDENIFSEEDFVDEYIGEILDIRTIAELKTSEFIPEKKIKTVKNNLSNNFQKETKIEQTVIKKPDLFQFEIENKIIGNKIEVGVSQLEIDIAKTLNKIFPHWEYLEFDIREFYENKNAGKQDIVELKNNEEIKIIQTKIEKIQIANLGFEREMINIFSQNEQEEKYNIFQKNEVILKNIDSDNSTFINQALPPFRKYSIPTILKKQKLEELKQP